MTNKILANTKPHFTVTVYYLIGFKVLHYHMYFICMHMFCCGFFFFQVNSYIRAVNDIYDKVDFDGIKLINFKVKSLKVRCVSAQTI